MRSVLVVVLIALTLVGCSTRQLTSNLNGSTAQRLVTHSIDDLMGKAAARAFKRLRGAACLPGNEFPARIEAKGWWGSASGKGLCGSAPGPGTAAPVWCAACRFRSEADQIMNVFYNSLATDQSDFGFQSRWALYPGLVRARKSTSLPWRNTTVSRKCITSLGQAVSNTVALRSKQLCVPTLWDCRSLPYLFRTWIVRNSKRGLPSARNRHGEERKIYRGDDARHLFLGLSTHHTDSILFTTGGIGIYARPASQFQLIHGSTSDSHAKPAR